MKIKLKKAISLFIMAFACICAAVPVFASGGEGNSVGTAMTSAASTIVSDALSSISGIIPVAAPILGAFIIIGIAIATIKKFTGRK